MKPIEDRYRKKKRKIMSPADVEAVSARTGGRPPRSATGPRAGGPPGARTDWGEVGEWYDALVGDQGSEYHREVVLPGVMRLLAPGPADVAVDVACGQGVLCRLLHAKGVRVTGVDAAGSLIQAAIARGNPAIEYRVADARHLRVLPAEHFTLASCVLAIQNIDPIAPVFEGVARLLVGGGRFVLVMMHPAFRVPQQAHWEWDPGTRTQFRRVDRYMIAAKTAIRVHPGSNPAQQIWAFHRPLQTYINALGAAGLLVDRMEEWTSHKKSEPGPRAEAEDRARKEIPLFLALRAVKPRAQGV